MQKVSGLWVMGLGLGAVVVAAVAVVWLLEHRPEATEGGSAGHSAERAREEIPPGTGDLADPGPDVKGEDRELAEVERAARPVVGGVVRGELRLGDAPAAGATLRLLPVDGSNGPRSVLSDAEGRFRIDGIAPGEWVLKATTGTAGHRHRPLRWVGGERYELGVLRLIDGQERRLRVLDASGEPVRDVELSWLEGGSSRRVSSDAQGEATMGFLVAGHYAVRASHPEFFAEGAAFVDVPDEDLTTTLVLRRARTLEGRVVGTDGEGIEGALVRTIASRREEPLVRRSAADGSFRIAVPRSRGWTLEVRAAGHVRREIEGLSADDPIRVVLQPGTRWRIQAEAEDGSAVSIARCTAWTETRRERRREEDLRVRALGPGEVELAFPEVDESYCVCLEAEGFEPWWSEEFHLEDLGATPHRAVLRRGHDLDVVLSGGDVAIEGATVILHPGELPDPSREEDWSEAIGQFLRPSTDWCATAVTDVEGRARLRALPAGPAWLELRHEGHAPARAAVHIGEDRQVELALQAGASVHGRAVDASGEPWSGRVLLAGGDFELRSQQTDSEGRFVFDAVEPGWYRLVPRPAGPERESRLRGILLRPRRPRQRDGDDVVVDGQALPGFEVDSESVHRELEVRLPQAAELRGQVRVDGEPGRDLIVRWTWSGDLEDGGQPLWHPTEGETRTREDGSYRLPGVHGPLELELRSADRRFVHTVPGPRVEPGETAELDIEAFSARLRLRVRDAEGQPIPGLQGLLSPNDAAGPFELEPTAEGELELTGLRPGAYSWLSWAPGWRTGYAECELEAGEWTERETRLEKGGWICLRLEFPDEAGAPSAVHYRLEAKARSGRRSEEGTTHRDAEGLHWLTPVMTSGELSLRAWTGAVSEEHATHRAETTLRLPEQGNAQLELVVPRVE